MKISELISMLERMEEVADRGTDAEVWLDCSQVSAAIDRGSSDIRAILKLDNAWLLVG